MRTHTFAILGMALGTVLASHQPAVRRAEHLCSAAISASAEQLEALNVNAGMKPHTPFSIDDYCGAGCQADNICLDECRACLGEASGRSEQ